VERKNDLSVGDTIVIKNTKLPALETKKSLASFNLQSVCGNVSDEL